MRPLSPLTWLGGQALRRRVLRLQLPKGEESQTRQPDARFGAKEGSGNGIRSQTSHDEDSRERYELSAGRISHAGRSELCLILKERDGSFSPPFRYTGRRAHRYYPAR